MLFGRDNDRNRLSHTARSYQHEGHCIKHQVPYMYYILTMICGLINRKCMSHLDNPPARLTVLL